MLVECDQYMIKSYTCIYALASSPDLPQLFVACSFSVLQATKSWGMSGGYYESRYSIWLVYFQRPLTYRKISKSILERSGNEAKLSLSTTSGDGLVMVPQSIPLPLPLSFTTRSGSDATTFPIYLSTLKVSSLGMRLGLLMTLQSLSLP